MMRGPAAAAAAAPRRPQGGGAAAALLAAFLLCQVRSCAGLYEEDAGRWDWLRETFGHVVHADFGSPTTTRGRAARMLFVCGDGGTVGAISPKTGAIIWRRVLGGQEGCAALRVATPTLLIVVSAAAQVHAFTLEDGALLWEGRLPQGSHVAGVLPESPKTWPSVVALEAGAEGPTLAFHSVRADEDERSFVVDFDSVTRMAVPKDRWPVASAGDAAVARVLQSGAVAVANAAVALVNGARVSVLAVADESWHEVALTGLPGGATQFVATCGRGAVVAPAARGRSAAVTVDLAKRPFAVVSVAQPSDAHGCAQGRDGAVLPVSANSGRSTLRVEVGEELNWELPDTPVDRHGVARRIWAAPGEKSWRTLAVMDDSSSVFAAGLPKQGLKLWAREEGLGRLVDVVATDIPHEEGGQGSQAAVYSQLLLHQLQHLEHFIVTLPQRAARFVRDVSGTDLGVDPGTEEDSGDKLVADHFGLQRLLVLATRRSITCLHTSKGRVVWQFHAGAILQRRGTVGKEQEVEVLRILKSEGGKRDSPKLYVWLRAGERDAVIDIDHVTGAVNDAHLFPGKMRSGAVVQPAHSEEAEKERESQYAPAVFVDEKLRVYTYPQNSQHVLESSKRRVFTHHTDLAESTLSGYTLTGSSAEPAWSVRLDRGSGERIVATSLSTHDPYNYIVKDNIRVLQNTTTNKAEIYTKYINPNAIVVVTHAGDTARGGRAGQEEAGKKFQGGYLVLYLIDGVTGAVLASMMQTNAQPPVHVVAVEHMVLYHFQNTKRVRYQLGVWELFDDLERYRGLTAESTTSAKYLIRSITGARGDHVTSAFEQQPPLLVPMAFSFPSPARAMGTTTSGRGIQPKHLICALATDEIVAIDLQRHVDAHQKGVTAVGWAPTSVLSYNRSVIGIDRIYTFPTNLESTSLVLASGHDLFYSRVAPGKPFDVLGENFSYSMLSLTLLVVTLATVVLHFLTQRKKIKQQWA